MKKLFVILALLLVGCEPQEPTPWIFTAPTTDAPIDAPICETLIYEVKVTSGRVTAIDVTLSNATGDTEQGSFTLPFRKTFRMCDTFNFKYISSQIVKPTSGAGTIKCTIKVDGVIVSSAIASGFPSIAGCSD